MKDIQTHLQRLHEQASECELIRDLATQPEKRELFDRLARHHRELAKQLEAAISAKGLTETFLGGKTQQPIPKGD